MAEKAIAAGARFLVSPNLDAEVIKTALDNDVLPMPGVMTPTEIVQALKYGAPIVKLFPSSSLGAGYVKELKGPFSNLKLIAVGGINKDNIKDFIKAGAIGAGIGGSLVDKTAIEHEDYTKIAEYAKLLRESLC
jgi:2-dehydro-3-deoxyphosphogluconate aldolase/(4S)-4-hydroxy-2-oxoglutarate aldolase